MQILEIFVFSIAINIVIFIPVAKKCEFRLKTSIIVIIWSSILTGIIVSLISPKRVLGIVVLELIFAIVFTGLIGIYRFYRDPERKILDIKNAILSPADGFVRYIKYNANEVIIGITLTYLDVHINRSPIAGKIVTIRHAGDGFLSLKSEKGIKENKRTEMVIDNRMFKISLILIASRLVRKILVWVKEGQEIKQGERIGKIVFGSQTDIIIPKLPELKIKVKEKQQVYAGLTVLAEYKNL